MVCYCGSLRWVALFGGLVGSCRGLRLEACCLIELWLLVVAWCCGLVGLRGCGFTGEFWCVLVADKLRIFWWFAAYDCIVLIGLLFW